MDFRHEQTFQNDTVELALGTPGQESVQLASRILRSLAVWCHVDQSNLP